MIKQYIIVSHDTVPDSVPIVYEAIPYIPPTPKDAFKMSYYALKKGFYNHREGE